MTRSAIDSDYTRRQTMAIDILRATNDGNDLSPVELKLTELAANGNLSETGKAALDELHANTVQAKP